MIKFTYIAVYQIRGLTLPPKENSTVIYSKESSDSSTKAILTSTPDQDCSEIDRALALGYLMLKGMMGQREVDAVSIEIERIRENRKIWRALYL